MKKSGGEDGRIVDTADIGDESSDLEWMVDVRFGLGALPALAAVLLCREGRGAEDESEIRDECLLAVGMTCAETLVPA